MKAKKVLTALCGASLATVMTFGALATGCAGNIGEGDENINVSQDQITQIQQKYDEAGAVYEYTGSPVTITMSHWDSDGASIERAVLEVLLEAFNKRYPSITVDLEIISDYETTYSTRFATNDVHDVFLVSDGVFTNWVKGSTQTMVNLSPYIAASDLVDMDDMFDSVVTRYQYDPATGLTGQGNQMTMPRDISAHVMYYNKDLFEQFGVELPPSDLRRSRRIWTATALPISTVWRGFRRRGSSGRRAATSSTTVVRRSRRSSPILRRSTRRTSLFRMPIILMRTARASRLPER